MSKKTHITKHTDLLLSLRKKAENELQRHNENKPGLYSGQDLEWLVHELQVQKIELEMQNEQLIASNKELETQKSKFTGLFDLAPVGYFILDIYGKITEVNHTGSLMLGISKSQLIDKYFNDFITREHFTRFTDFLESIQIHSTTQGCSLEMIKQDTRFYAQLEGIVPAYDHPETIRCYIAVADITEQRNARQLQERELLNATIMAQENERKRVSEALHNSVGQLLYGIKLNMDQPIDDRLHRKLNDLLDQAIRETRNISFELAPSILTNYGLKATLDEMAERLSAGRLQIRVLSKITGRLDLALETDVFRMIQELVNNSIRHGNATLITVSLRDTGKLVIEVADNGNGFDFKKPVASGSGLAAIRNRLTLYNGEITVLAVPGKGCTVRLVLAMPGKPGFFD